MNEKYSTLEINRDGKLVSNETLYNNIAHEVTGLWEITNVSILDEISLKPEDLIQPIIE